MQSSVNSSAAIVESPSTVSSSLVVRVVGDSDSDELSDTLAAFSNAINSGALSNTEDPDSFESDADLSVDLNLDTQDSADTVDTDGQLSLDGTLTETEASDYLDAICEVVISGVFGATESQDNLVSFVGNVPVSFLRVFKVDAESRVQEIELENRTQQVRRDTHMAYVEAEDRTIKINKRS